MDLVSFNNFKKECIKFGEPVEDRHDGVKIPLTYNDNPFCLCTPTLFSFGVQECKYKNKKTGYQIPLTLHSKNGVTTVEKIFTKCLSDIQSQCHGYLEKNFSPDVSPVLYLKLNWVEKGDIILTRLRTKEKVTSSLLGWMQGYCKVIAVISFKSIYIGEKSIRIQVKAEEIYFVPLPRKAPLLEIEEEEN